MLLKIIALFSFLAVGGDLSDVEQFSIKELTAQEYKTLQEARQRAHDANEALRKVTLKLRQDYGDSSDNTTGYSTAAVICKETVVDLRGKYALITRRSRGVCELLRISPQD